MSNPNTSSSDEDDESTSNARQKYTQEQKIVTAVWLHEKNFNGQTIKDIRNNFVIRFKGTPPNANTMTKWEKTLFSKGLFSFDRRAKKPTERLMHVPYVKASFREKPNITLRERRNQLGLSAKTLRRIIKYDLKESDLKPLSKDNTNEDNVSEHKDSPENENN